MDEWKNELIGFEEAKNEFKERSLNYRVIKGVIALKTSYEKKKEYSFLRETKNFCWFKQAKKKDEILEDKVWCLFYNMGFTNFSKGRNFKINWSDKTSDSKQIDVFCADEETVIISECKSGYMKTSLKENIESYKGILPEIKQSIQRVFKDVKIAFLYVTEGCLLSDEDEQRIKDLNNILPSYHFDEKTLDNYCQLVSQIGSAAKYQLLGLIFKGRRIKNLENKVNAIEGKMGGLTYYSFSIKPSQLLKMAYVLHRNNANSTEDMMPSYQRIIKKDRLVKIRDFIEHKKGFFPNAIIVSIRTKNENDKTLQFEPASGQDASSLSRIGVVKLPQEYQTAYVIDGQHRLYGYSSTSYADKNSIPVIAFVNMKKEEQVQMFMDINQNQKAVPKVLRDTLEADLLYSSDKYQSVNIAIKKRIAMKLGERHASPLCGMVLTGENPTNENVPLTIDGINKALNKTRFFNQYDKNNKMIKNGFLDYGISKNDNSQKEQTEETIFELLSWTFNYIKKNVGEKWNKEPGFLITNNLVGAIICLLNDFVVLNVKNKKLQDCHPNLDSIKMAIDPFMLDLCLILCDFTSSNNEELRKFKGEGGLIDSWHLIGSKLFKIDNAFSPDWLPEYLDKYCQENANEALIILNKIEASAKQIVKEQLHANYGQNWDIQGIPKNLAAALNNRLFEERVKSIASSDEFQKDLIDVSDFGELHKIIKSTQNYNAFGKKIFKNTSPELFSSWDNKTDLLDILNQLKKMINNGKNLPKNDFEDLKKYGKIFEAICNSEECKQ